MILVSLISLLAKTHFRAISEGCTGDVLSSVHDKLSAELDYWTFFFSINELQWADGSPSGSELGRRDRWSCAKAAPHEAMIGNARWSLHTSALTDDNSAILLT